MSGKYTFLSSFSVEGHPYILGRQEDGNVSIWRVNDAATDLLPTGQQKPFVLAGYGPVAPFELKGRPYLCASVPGGCPAIWGISGGPTPRLQRLTQ